MTPPATMQSEAMRRSGAIDPAGDDAERRDEEERRNMDEQHSWFKTRNAEEAHKER